MLDLNKFYEIQNNLEINIIGGTPTKNLVNLFSYLSQKNDYFYNAFSLESIVSLALGTYQDSNKTCGVILGENNICELLALIKRDIVNFNFPIIFFVALDKETVEDNKDIISTLKMNNISYEILANNDEACARQLNHAQAYVQNNKNHHVFLLKPNSFSEHKQIVSLYDYSIIRESVVERLVNKYEDSHFFCTNSIISSDIYLTRKSQELDISPADFLYPNNSLSALNIAQKFKTNKLKFVIQDSSQLLAQLSSNLLNHKFDMDDIVHIVFNSGGFLNDGMIKSNLFQFDFEKLAQFLNYKKTKVIEKEIDLEELFDKNASLGGAFIEIRTTSHSKVNSNLDLVEKIIQENSLMKK